MHPLPDRARSEDHSVDYEYESDERHETLPRQRKKLPTATKTEVLVRCRHRCCMCFGLCGDVSIKAGQIAHLDRNRSNASLDNLAFLCLQHHDQYDSRHSQATGYTKAEVKQYRAHLHDYITRLPATPTSPDRPTVRFKLDFSFADFTKEGLDHLKDTIQTCVGAGADVEIVDVCPGSVIVTLFVSKDVLAPLITALQQGRFASFNVTKIEIEIPTESCGSAPSTTTSRSAPPEDMPGPPPPLSLIDTRAPTAMSPSASPENCSKTSPARTNYDGPLPIPSDDILNADLIFSVVVLLVLLIIGAIVAYFTS